MPASNRLRHYGALSFITVCFERLEIHYHLEHRRSLNMTEKSSVRSIS